MAAVIAIVSPSHPSPAVTHRMVISSIAVLACEFIVRMLSAFLEMTSESKADPKSAHSTSEVRRGLGGSDHWILGFRHRWSPFCGRLDRICLGTRCVCARHDGGARACPEGRTCRWSAKGCRQQQQDSQARRPGTECCRNRSPPGLQPNDSSTETGGGLAGKAIRAGFDEAEEV